MRSVDPCPGAEFVAKRSRVGRRHGVGVHPHGVAPRNNLALAGCGPLGVCLFASLGQQAFGKVDPLFEIRALVGVHPYQLRHLLAVSLLHGGDAFLEARGSGATHPEFC